MFAPNGTSHGIVFDAEEVMMTSAIQTWWSNFARTGHPGTASECSLSSSKAHDTQCSLTTLHPCDCVDTDGIEWPTYSASQRNLVRIETPANIIQDDSLGFCDFWDSIGYVHPCSRLLLLLPSSLSSLMTHTLRLPSTRLQCSYAWALPQK